MASRRFLSSVLRSSLLRGEPNPVRNSSSCSLKESQLKTSRISSLDLSHHFSSIPMGILKSNGWKRWGSTGIASVCGGSRLSSFKSTSLSSHFISRCVTMEVKSGSTSQESFDSEVTPRIKFKRLDKTANHIMKILDKEAVEEVRAQREIPEIKPGYIVQLKVEVPENKRRVSLLKGIVIARRNAGLNSTFRIRRLVAGVGVESVFPLYSPNIKEIKVIDKKKVRRAKLYYLRDKMNALKKQ